VLLEAVGSPVVIGVDDRSAVLEAIGSVQP
jgi:hypothetical protein